MSMSMLRNDPILSIDVTRLARNGSVANSSARFRSVTVAD